MPLRRYSHTLTESTEGILLQVLAVSIYFHGYSIKLTAVYFSCHNCEALLGEGKTLGCHNIHQIYKFMQLFIQYIFWLFQALFQAHLMR